ncbi:cellulose binding domain-containing protein [Actinophytocola sp.]|uniref:cellulose binding domain-containing protein n=1 Tax=Actinophytocola sp. TaxID=1872138 RepID=UPI00389A6A67
MRRRLSLCGLVAALIAVLTFAVAQSPAAAPAPIRIMPLGDSITAAPGCWRAYLWDHLRTAGYTNVDFVGTQNSGGCSVPLDADHEGHSGFTATGIADQNQLPAWLSATHPDVVVMHLGTNDVWNGTISTATILTAYSKLVDQMRASNPNMKIIVAQILPMAPSGCTGCPQGVVALDNAIPGWAAGKTTAASPITVVDQWTGFSTATDTFDGVHPVDSGFQKMANRFYPAVAAALGDPPPPDTDPPPTGTCAATYKLVGQWSDGFQGEVTVRNDGTTTSSSWTATFSFANGQQVSQAWNATVTQSGAAVTAKNVSWNGALAPNATATFGFLANQTGSNTAPAVTCTVT